MSQKVPLEEQVVLITGASSGMSAVVGQQLAQQFDRRRQHDAIEIRARYGSSSPNRTRKSGPKLPGSKEVGLLGKRGG